MSLKMDKGFRERLGYYAFGIAIGLVMVGAIFAARGMMQGQQPQARAGKQQPQQGVPTKPSGTVPAKPQ